MEALYKIEVLGDSILKGVQVDGAGEKYVTRCDIDIPGLSREFGLAVRNDSHFGATVDRGGRLLDRLWDRGLDCGAVVMDFGGNDCDLDWAAIAADPAGSHPPKLPLPDFFDRYRRLIRGIRRRGVRVILTTLPPLCAQRFFDWRCGGLDRGAVLEFLGSVDTIYAHQARYSRAVEALAREEGTALVDLRAAFLRQGDSDRLLCVDGTHPNSAGQAVITQAFREFALARRGGAA